MTSAPHSTQKSFAAVTRPNATAVGVIVWLGSEVMFFAGLFSIYFSLRATNPGLWHEHLIENSILNVPFALGNTLILVSSSVTAQFGVFAAERLQARRTSWNPKHWGMIEWFTLTFILGAIFVSGQIYEYAALVSHGLSIGTDPYGTAFYLTTGFHGLHVAGGLGAFLMVIGRAFAAKRFGHYEATTAVVVSYYWHFVDAVWIVLFGVIYFAQ